MDQVKRDGLRQELRRRRDELKSRDVPDDLAAELVGHHSSLVVTEYYIEQVTAAGQTV